MQNRYVADFGDYVKLAILRGLLGEHSRMRLGVAWWLFPDECHNRDGSHREYLHAPDKWRSLDSDLFDALKKLDNEKRRHVRALEEDACLPSDAVFASDLVPCDVRPFVQRPLERKQWLSGIKARLGDCDIVFLDPDNGIASDGLKLTQRRAGKSVTVEEIEELAQNRATIVYHHQTRRVGGHISEIYTLATQLRKRGLRVSGALRAKPWSPRVFFILNGNRELQGRAGEIAERWENKISWHSDAELLSNSG
jgi:hypothetical protein